jgi:hypothetical protein
MLKSKSKLLYDWQSVCPGIEYSCGICDQILFPVEILLSEMCCLLSVGHPLWQEDGSAICIVIIQWSESLRTRNHILLSHLRLPQPGGPGSRICIPQEQGGPVIPPGTGFPLRRLLRLAVVMFWRAAMLPLSGTKSLTCLVTPGVQWQRKGGHLDICEWEGALQLLFEEASHVAPGRRRMRHDETVFSIWNTTSCTTWWVSHSALLKTLWPPASSCAICSRLKGRGSTQAAPSQLFAILIALFKAEAEFCIPLLATLCRHLNVRIENAYIRNANLNSTAKFSGIREQHRLRVFENRVLIEHIWF